MFVSPSYDEFLLASNAQKCENQKTNFPALLVRVATLATFYLFHPPKTHTIIFGEYKFEIIHEMRENFKNAKKCC